MILRMFTVAGDGPLGFTPRVSEGWEKLFSTRPTPDSPSVDESIAAGYGFVLDRACGTFLPGDVKPVGGYWHGAGTSPGAAMTCDMRGPGAFGAFAKVGGLEAWIKACVVRTNVCLARGLEAAVYIGMPSVEAWRPGADRLEVRRILNSWVDPIQRAGFTRVMMDAVVNTEQGRSTPAMEFAEECVYRGIAFDHEGACAVTPTAFAWHNGRFGSVQSPEDRGKCEGKPGWFNSACEGAVKHRWLWVQGGGDRAAWKKSQMEAEEARGGHSIVDFGGMGLVKQ